MLPICQSSDLNTTVETCCMLLLCGHLSHLPHLPHLLTVNLFERLILQHIFRLLVYFLCIICRDKFWCSCTEHRWMHHLFPLNVKRSYHREKKNINVSLLLFLSQCGCVIEKHASTQSLLLSTHSTFFFSFFAFSLPYQLRALPLSHWSLVHTQKNHRDESRWTTKKLFSFETGAPQNLLNKWAKSSLEESSST